ncbi:hypothetical protein F4806DRAFT_459351 [Annulohypoxylon nitens]|nr:hypothetical protein F4806DRAFT_459351 [Annulohypoxylon nitens]
MNRGHVNWIGAMRNRLNKHVHGRSMIEDLMWIEPDREGIIMQDIGGPHKFTSYKDFHEPHFELTYGLRVAEARAIVYWAQQAGNPQTADIFRWAYWFIHNYRSYRYFLLESAIKGRIFTETSIKTHWRNSGGARIDLLYDNVLNEIFILMNVIRRRRRRYRTTPAELLPLRFRYWEFVANVRGWQWAMVPEQLWESVRRAVPSQLGTLSYPGDLPNDIEFDQAKELPQVPNLQLHTGPPDVGGPRTPPGVHDTRFSNFNQDITLLDYGYSDQSPRVVLTQEQKQTLSEQNPAGTVPTWYNKHIKTPKAGGGTARTAQAIRVSDDLLLSEDDSDPEPTPLADLYRNVINDSDRRPRQVPSVARPLAGLSSGDSLKRKAREDPYNAPDLKKRRRLVG